MSAHHAHAERANSDTVENYAKALYLLQSQADGGVATNALAERLGVTAGSASAMLKRLATLGIVEHEPYHGVQLTAEGERVALEVIRHHRLLELFLAEILGMPWDRVHEEAEVLEHHLSEHVEELIAAKLGQPTRDPHGDPIPSDELELERDSTTSLDALEPGESATFSRVSDSNAEMLRYLSARGIAPGVVIEVSGREPFGGPLTVNVDGSEHALGDELVRAMRVEAERA